MSILNIRSILLIAIALSSIAVIRQTITTQLAVMFTAVVLLFLHQERKLLLKRIFGRFRHLWYAIFAIFIVQVVFRREGDTLWEFYLLKITDNGLLYASSVAMRLINLILISGLLFSIPANQFMLAFKAWRLPFEISFLITTVIRFIPDYYRLFTAYQETLYLRNIDLKKLSLKNKIAALVSLLLPVLAANLSEVKSRAIALDLKGFRLFPERTYLHESKLNTIDYLIHFLAVIVFVALVFLI